jgi:hypothetical protein
LRSVALESSAAAVEAFGAASDRPSRRRETAANRASPMPANVVNAVTAAISVATMLAFGGGWWYATSMPSSSPAALSSGLLDARSVDGSALLSSTPFRVDHDVVARHFVGQIRRAYCGVASATIAVNALRDVAPPLTQQRFFTPAAQSVRASWQVSVAGMTLDQLADLLRAHDLAASVVHASESDLAAFRASARASLLDPSDVLIVNYDRAVLHQEGGGHISPVVAYHAATDRFLVLDVASHKYPPTWVAAEALWQAMNTLDASSGASRGFVLVRAGAPRALSAVAGGTRVAAQNPTSWRPLSWSVRRASSGVATSSPSPSTICRAARTCAAFEVASVPGPSHRLSSRPTRTLPPIAADIDATGS